MAVNILIAPKFAKLSNDANLNELSSLFVHASRLIILSTLPLIISMLFLPSLLLNFFGQEYANSTLALRILAFSQLINVGCGSVGYLLLMSGFEKKVQKASLLTTIISVFLIVLLIPTYGHVGAAIGTATGIIFFNLINAKYVGKLLKIKIKAIYTC